MQKQRYFKCSKCGHLIRFLHWNKEHEKKIKILKCPHCKNGKLEILKKRPYYRLKLNTYLSIVVNKNNEEIVLSK